MAANTNPIATLLPIGSVDNTNTTTSVLGATLTTAVNDYTGAGASAALVFTASVEGGTLPALRFKALGTNVATVARIYKNNGGLPTVAANNTFIGEVGLPITAASATAATSDIEYQLGLAGRLAPNERIYVQLATLVASGWRVSPVGGGRF